MTAFSGIVWGRPLTWGTATSLHTAFVIKAGEEDILVKCDFMCYVRWGDDVRVQGSMRTKERRITDYRVKGRYLHAITVENATLGLTFDHP